MEFSKRAFALAMGVLWAISIFICTIYVLYKGGGNTLVLLQQIFWSYTISWAGAFLGLIYGFIYGFIFGWLFALFYNAFLGKKE